MDQLSLETAEEFFCYGVVVRIAFAGNTLLDSVGFQLFLEDKCGVLDASVTVKDEPPGGLRRTAMSSAFRVSAVSIWLEKAQLTNLRVYRSFTMAR